MNLRQMEMSDADFMLELKNYPETRKFAIASHDEIKKEDHYKWLEKNIQFFKIIESYIGNRVGAIRVQENEISIWIHRDFRGLGLATKVLKKLPTYGMRAKIVDGNVDSMRAFVKVGFVPVEHIDNYYILEFQIWNWT